MVHSSVAWAVPNCVYLGSPLFGCLACICQLAESGQSRKSTRVDTHLGKGLLLPQGADEGEPQPWHCIDLEYILDVFL